MNSPLDNPGPSSPTPGSTDAPDKGSVLIGFLVGWGAMIGATVVAGAIMAGGGALMQWSPAFGVIASIAGLLPMAGLIALIVWYAHHGKTRSALGVVAAFGSLVALCLLLVAACFGLMSGTNFGR
jgi:hypothetical protein